MTAQCERSVPALDGGWGWVIVLCSFLNMALMTSIFFSFSVVFVELVEVFAVPTSTMAFLGSIQASMAYGFSAVTGALMHKFGNRAVAILGFVLAPSGLILGSFAQSVPVLYLTYGLIGGIGMSFGMSPSQVIVQQYFDKRRVLAGGFVICGMSVGSLAAAPFLRFLIDVYGWRGALMFHAGVVLHGVILSCSFRPLEQAQKRKPIYAPRADNTQTNSNPNTKISADKNGHSCSHDEQLITPDKNNPESLETEEVTTKEPEVCCKGIFRKIFFGFFDCTLWRSSAFTLYTLGSFCICFGSMTFPQHQVNFAVHVGTDKHLAALAPTVVGVFSLASRLIFSFVSNMPCVDRTLQYSITALLMGVVLAMGFLAQNFYHIAILCACFGVCVGTIEAIKPSVLVDLIGVDRISHAFGLFTTLAGVSIIFGSPLAGYLKDETNGYGIPFAVLGCVVFLGGILVMIIVIMQRRSPATREKSGGVGEPPTEEFGLKVSTLQSSMDQLNRSMSPSMVSLP